MLRQPYNFEKILFDIIKEYNHSFYYDEIFRAVEEEQFKIIVEKDREQMVGHAYISYPTNEMIEYEVRYNRIVNLSENYTLLIPGIKAG